MKQFLFFLFAAFTLASCGKYADGTSVWGGGAFLAFWIPFLAAVYLGWKGYQSWASGSITGGSSATPGTQYSKQRVKPWQVWQWIFAAALLVFAIIVVVVQNAGK